MEVILKSYFGYFLILSLLVNAYTYLYSSIRSKSLNLASDYNGHIKNSNTRQLDLRFNQKISNKEYLRYALSSTNEYLRLIEDKISNIKDSTIDKILYIKHKPKAQHSKKYYNMIYTLAHWAADFGSPKATQIILESEKDQTIPFNINAEDAWGLTPLYRAILRGDREIVKLFLIFGADINKKFTDIDQMRYKIWKENKRPDINMLRILTQPIDPKNYPSYSLLKLAAKNNLVDIVFLLTSFGANLEEIKDLEIYNAAREFKNKIIDAIRTKNLIKLKELAADGYGFDVTNNETNTNVKKAIDIAAANGDSKIFGFLLLNGLIPTGNTIELLIANNRWELFTLLNKLLFPGEYNHQRVLETIKEHQLTQEKAQNSTENKKQDKNKVTQKENTSPIKNLLAFISDSLYS